MCMEIKCNCGHNFTGVNLFEVQKSRNAISREIDVVSCKRNGDKWVFRCPKCKSEIAK
ncbi:hypothetical protein A5888_000671 [Enterococcus sp. 9E7_DIV0242]|uniref:Uncharacterized protein n=1 Tax=Candidatus Enterococcus clewellii TaxID=1834193 RepID=A0AAQ3VS58_9ENTE